MTLRNAKIILFFTTAVLLFVSLIVIAVYVRDSRGSQNGSGNGAGLPAASDSGTTVAFAELTVPYLRDRTYQSSLGPLEQYSQNGSFTSFLTNYDSDGLNINGLLAVPNGEMPEGGWPGIVFVHGYVPPSVYRTTDRYGEYVAYLASNGFAVFKIDLRGHGSSDGTPNGAYFSGDYVVDTLNARAALQQSELVNRDKIALWGHSMAGNVVLRSFVAARDMPAIVIWAGAVFTYDDMRQYGIEDNSYSPPSEYSERQQERRRLMDTHGNFSAGSPFWRQVAPVNYLDGLGGAIQLHHSVDDQVVSVEYSRNLSSILEEKGIRHELNEYEGGGHNIDGSAFTPAMQNTVDFLKEELD